jgi:thiol-disulfide isomerase/thioredoxin
MNRHAIVLFLTLLLAPLALQGAQSPTMVGEPLPDIRLAMPENPDHRDYLGLSGDGPVPVGSINAEVLLIEIFNMYCPHCQREAPAVNRFFQRIQQDPALNRRVKLIGIGVGNSLFEVDHFRKVYQVPFPLFPDPDYQIHKTLGEVRTPYFIGVRSGSNNDFRVFYSELGGSKSAQKLLEQMLQSAGLASGGSTN